MNFEQYDNDLLSSKKNTMFSKLRGEDLKELLFLVNNYSLSFRESLGFDKSYQFGCELEYEKVIRLFVNFFIKHNFWRWDSKKDGTCEFGGEIATPILKDRKKDWIELKNVCDFLKSKCADMLHNASCHVHVDRTPLVEVKHNRQFLKIIGCYEPVMFRFAYGDKISPRKKILEMAAPVADLIMESLNEINTYDVKYMSFPQIDKYNSINYLTKGKNTIEFRLFNATRYAEIVQNYVCCAVNTLTAPKRELVDEEYLDYVLENDFISPAKSFYLYSEILLERALNYVDTVFSNNLDKVCFLVQYIKKFQNSYGANNAILGKKIVKK